MIRYTSLIIAFIFIQKLSAQYDHQAVLPGLSGNALLEQLVLEYKPATVLDFGDSKDTLYGTIYNLHDSVRCVYSGHTLYLEPGSDPSQAVYLNGSNDGINAEHTYPRSKGADSGNARSDLYNLFPTRLQVNGDRGNLPFGEIPDQETDFWYWKDDKQSNIPGENIDAYSEITESFFEPREDHKGNVARAIFYFVTMYAEQVAAADPNYFEPMREDLCNWHYADPVDSLEWIRNYLIASYQSDRPNPFILDCSLAGRTYCDYIDDACTAVPVQKSIKAGEIRGIQLLYPNPFEDRIRIKTANEVKIIKLEMYDFLGKKVVFSDELNVKLVQNDSTDREILIEESSDGIYLLKAILKKPGEEPWGEEHVLIRHTYD